MRRFALLLSSIIVVLLGCAVVISRPPAAAQEATPAAMAEMATHPVASVWTFVNGEGEDAFPSVAIFDPDGSYIEVLPWGAVILGAWQPTGERTAELTQILNDLEEGTNLMRGQGRATLEVDETGNTMIWHGVFLGRYEDGSIAFAFGDDAPSIGTRLQAGPMVSLETLAATPVVSGAATPMP